MWGKQHTKVVWTCIIASASHNIKYLFIKYYRCDI
jgi:hypothetical protein